ncbi:MULTISPECIES: polysaccharide biosynthesis protein [Mesorhizobium]|uniref:Polysaccharide biosynthesis protein n=1 Tax=Mesorhizobium denitrificans TaxID=2294114 RepID=A0A371X918_9HYPH|nr:MULTISPECIES: nucleoside-diphosphate sugar epimerase/dehydratase [Mesorhizobium]RFC65728.1 polysaccharide biosynthesis protein [Mesorhizobium denitrificans]
MRNLYQFVRQKGWLPYISFAHDVIVALIAFVAAFAVAYNTNYLSWIPDFPQKIAAFVALSTICIYVFRVNRTSWRYVSAPDVLEIIKAVVAAVVIYTAGAFLVSRGQNVPRSVPVLTAIFMIGGMVGSRFAYRLMLERRHGSRAAKRTKQAKRRVILYGMNDEADSFIRSVRRAGNGTFEVAAIVDDSLFAKGRIVQGVRVRGRLGDLPNIQTLLQSRGKPASELIITDPNHSRKRLGEIVEAGTAAGLKVLRLPDRTSTTVLTSDQLLEPKEIELGDLLGRPEIKADLQGVSSMINGRVVLVTGGGGSIGSELCRQIAMLGPQKLIVTDNSEFLLYNLDTELRDRHPQLALVAHILDVRDRARVNQIFEEFKPQLVFHAAALKHVPLVESNPLEAIKTNLLGTRNVADAALANSALSFVMISTDKAVNPTNVMGATKRSAESYCQALDVSSDATSFKTVRFGNVLGSNGSVVPRFKEQIAAGGPVTVTHPDIIRFFMTIPEAVRLVLNASSHAMHRANERGKIMVLDMGKPVRILHLAERMIQLAGFKPYTDVDIVFSGLRPGEKLYEELFDKSEVREDTAHDGYFVASPRMIDHVLLNKSVAEIESALAREDRERALMILHHIVPEFIRNERASSEPENRPLSRAEAEQDQAIS